MTPKVFKSAVDLAHLAKSHLRPRVEKLFGAKATTARLKSKCTHQKECFMIYSNRTLTKQENKLVLDLKRSHRSSHWVIANASTHRLSLEDNLPAVQGAAPFQEPRLIAFRSKVASNKDDTKVSASVMVEKFSPASVSAFVKHTRGLQGKLSMYGGSPSLLKRKKLEKKKTHKKKSSDSKKKTTAKKTTPRSKTKPTKPTPKKSKKQLAADKKNDKERRAREAQRRAEMEEEAADFIPRAVSEEELDDEDDTDPADGDYGDEDDSFIDLDEEEDDDER